MGNKINVISFIAGIFIILVSVANYLMNEDYVTLGIFVFSGIGLILISLKNSFGENNSARITKYGTTFLFGAAVILVYWFLKAKLNLF